MTLERSIRLLAGTLLLASLLLATVFSTRWLLLGAFVGLNLVQSSFTGFCPAETVLRRVFDGGDAG